MIKQNWQKNIIISLLFSTFIFYFWKSGIIYNYSFFPIVKEGQLHIFADWAYVIKNGICNNLGFDITTCSEVRVDAFLFGESPSRVIVSVREVKEDRFLDILKDSNISFALIGHVSKGEIRIDDRSFGDISEYKEIYNTALAAKLK